MFCSPTGLLLLTVRSAFTQIVLEKLRTQRAASFGSNKLTGQNADDDFRFFLVFRADADLPNMEHFGRAWRQVILVADEDHMAVAFPMNRLIGDDQSIIFRAQDDLPLAK